MDIIWPDFFWWETPFPFWWEARELMAPLSSHGPVSMSPMIKLIEFTRIKILLTYKSMSKFSIANQLSFFRIYEISFLL